MSKELQQMYNRRFGEDRDFRMKMWKILAQYFQRYIKQDSTVLDLAAGYCEFINNINANRKIAADINPDVKSYANGDVEIVNARCDELADIKPNSVDVTFTSNFFEHLPKPEIVSTIQEVKRVLRPGGKFMILQPNIRYCTRNYWMFFDHITPLDHDSLCEALELQGFRIRLCKPRFLPYTTKSWIPKSILLIKLYLRVPLVQWLMGKQTFVIAEKN